MSLNLKLACLSVGPIEWSMELYLGPSEHRDIDFLHEIGERIAAADPLYLVLKQIVLFISGALSAIPALCIFWKITNHSEGVPESASRSGEPAEASRRSGDHRVGR